MPDLLSFYHGVLNTRVDSDEGRPIEISSPSIIGAVVTAPDADDNIFPYNMPVPIFANDTKTVAALGNRGTAPWVLDGIIDQGWPGVMVVVRVPRHPKPFTSVLLSLTNNLIVITGEVVTRSTEFIDSLAYGNIETINRVYSGDLEYQRGTDWKRNGDSIEWLVYNSVENIIRGTGTVDVLTYAHDAVEINSVFSTSGTYVLGVDYQIHAEGIEWLGSNQPPVHSEYQVDYRYGKMPTALSSYQVDYSYNDYETKHEIVNRTVNSESDWLSQQDIVSIFSIEQGDVSYSEGDDFELLDDKIHWLSTSAVESIVRSSEIFDVLANSDLCLDILEVSSGINIYVKNVDWENLDGTVNWISANQPAENETYSVTYRWGKRPADNTDYEVTYRFKTGELVATSSVIGGINMDTGVYEGVHVLTSAHNLIGVKPKILIAPGFTQNVSVTQEMIGVAEELLAVIIADAPGKNQRTANNFRYEFGSERVYIVEPWVKYFNRYGNHDIQPSSARVAGLFNRVDNLRGGPWWSPSNHIINGIEGISRPISPVEANLLNSHEVNVITRNETGGYKLWGNRTCATDPTYSFITSVRVTDLIEDALVQGIQFFVDHPINQAFFQSVTETINGFLRELANKQAILLGDEDPAFVSPEDNSIAQIKKGEIVIHYRFGLMYPAEKILLKMTIHSEYIKQLFEDAPYVRSAN